MSLRKKALFASLCVLLIVGFLALPLMADEDGDDRPLVRFRGGIGVIPVRGTAPPFTANVVHNIIPAVVPWVIADLRADVRLDGSITVDGRGLLLAGGNNIGRTGNLSVRARLICSGLFHDSGAVPLDADGDFRIDGVLMPVPPDPCDAAVLLILLPSGAWSAAGIPAK